MVHGEDLGLTSLLRGNAARPIIFLEPVRSGTMPGHNDQSFSAGEYSAPLVDATQWLEQARRQTAIPLEVFAESPGRRS
jgi:hypothetical protein